MKRKNNDSRMKMNLDRPTDRPTDRRYNDGWSGVFFYTIVEMWISPRPRHYHCTCALDSDESSPAHTNRQDASWTIRSTPGTTFPRPKRCTVPASRRSWPLNCWEWPRCSGKTSSRRWLFGNATCEIDQQACGTCSLTSTTRGRPSCTRQSEALLRWAQKNCKRPSCCGLWSPRSLFSGRV